MSRCHRPDSWLVFITRICQNITFWKIVSERRRLGDAPRPRPLPGHPPRPRRPSRSRCSPPQATRQPSAAGHRMALYCQRLPSPRLAPRALCGRAGPGCGGRAGQRRSTRPADFAADAAAQLRDEQALAVAALQGLGRRRDAVCGGSCSNSKPQRSTTAEGTCGGGGSDGAEAAEVGLARLA